MDLFDLGTDDGEDVVQKVADMHGIDRDEAQEIVEDIQGETDQPIACTDCGQAYDPPRTVVLNFPDPIVDDPNESPVRCVDCWAELIASETLLTEIQAKVYALELAGYSQKEIGDLLGRSTGTISTYAHRVGKKREKAHAQIGVAERTIDVLQHRRPRAGRK